MYTLEHFLGAATFFVLIAAQVAAVIVASKVGRDEPASEAGPSAR